MEHSKKGVVELKQAETYQKSARPIMCMGILMVLIIIMVIGEEGSGAAVSRGDGGPFLLHVLIPRFNSNTFVFAVIIVRKTPSD